jgi:hypothetical protein
VIGPYEVRISSIAARIRSASPPFDAAPGKENRKLLAPHSTYGIPLSARAHEQPRHFNEGGSACLMAV